MPADVKRFEHGSRVPGWDEPVDLRRTRRGIPDPATTPVPADLRAEIEDYMARYPDPAARRSPRWRPPSDCTAGARPRRSSRSPA